MEQDYLTILKNGEIGAFSLEKYTAPNANFLDVEINENEVSTEISIWDQQYKNLSVKPSYKVAFINSPGGEEAHSLSFKYSAEKIGWQVQLYKNEATPYIKDILKFDPDFMIFAMLAKLDLSEEIIKHPSKKYYLSLGLFPQFRHKIEDKQQPMLNFDGVIALESNLERFNQKFIDLNKNFYALDILPATSILDNDPAEPNSLMWCGMGWDSFRSSEKYKYFLKALSQSIVMKVYGPKYKFNFLTSDVYGGFTGAGIEHIEVIRNNGIYLLTHSDMHIKAGIPSLRIFEAIAANAVIISDLHPFVINNFGSNVLYFNQSASGEEIYKTIKEYFYWVKNNTEEAKLMAKRNNLLFRKKFSIDKDLLRIAKMHEYITTKGEKDVNRRIMLK